MRGVHRQDEMPLARNRFLAVAIKEVAEGQLHTGIFFRVNEEDQHEFLHLGWHYQLRRHPASTAYYWLQPNLPQGRLVHIAALCDSIANANANGIPYAFGPPNSCFDESTCEFLLGPTRTGLTCASFVLAVFHRAGVPLVRYSSWPAPSEEDRNWQQWVLQMLEEQGASEDHIAHVAREVGTSVRYRPEQVAAAALKRRWRPVSYSKAARVGRVVAGYIRGNVPTASAGWWERVLNWFRRNGQAG